MREYILTEHEREIIRRVLNGERPDGFRVIKLRTLKALPTLEDDLKLIKEFLKAT